MLQNHACEKRHIYSIYIALLFLNDQIWNQPSYS